MPTSLVTSTAAPPLFPTITLQRCASVLRVLSQSWTTETKLPDCSPSANFMQLHRVKLGSIARGVAVVQPLGMLRVFWLASRIGGFCVEVAFRVATGYKPQVRQQEQGLILPGSEAPFGRLDKHCES